jgi:hypothetical protein
VGPLGERVSLLLDRLRAVLRIVLDLRDALHQRPEAGIPPDPSLRSRDDLIRLRADRLGLRIGIPQHLLGSRFLALTEDPDLVALLSDGEPLGASITLRHNDNVNRAVLR